MEDCIFCKICEGELPSSTIYEDKLIKIIMNINPISNGHLLVIPKDHYTNLLDLNRDVLDHSIEVVKDTIYPTLKDKLNCGGLTLAQNNELGQEIKHFHIHLIPRYKDDNIEFPTASDIKEVEEIFKKLID